MSLRLVLAVLHLLALGVGLGAVYARARAMRRLDSSPDSLRAVLAADSWWGVAGLTWVVTGLWRAIAGTEKVSGYYWSNPVFHAKLGLVALILLLELWPMVTLIRWRIAQRRGTLGDPASLAPAGRRLARVSDVQTLLSLVIVVLAAMLARGYGAH
jgi:putative membrane protein